MVLLDLAVVCQEKTAKAKENPKIDKEENTKFVYNDFYSVLIELGNFPDVFVRLKISVAVCIASLICKSDVSYTKVTENLKF